MPGRNALPPQLHIHKGNPNRLTNAELKRRQDSQIKLGDNNFIIPPHIKNNILASKKWEEVIGIYQENNVDFATSADTGLIARYCMTWAEYMCLLKSKEEVLKIFNLKKMQPHMIAKNMNKLQYENNLNKKSELLLKMEGQLFLTPLAKVKNIPMKPAAETEQENMLDQLGFENV